MRLLLSLFLLNSLTQALPFSLIKHESSSEQGPTLFVIGGIHGNEPGSYFAASVLAQYYTITKGNLWVIPNLNHKSIMMNSRGINGDMNRKFADIDISDADYPIVNELKKIIIDPQVDLILNLHDGHGFYRKEYKNTIFNPGAWGQTCVIDQGTLDCDHQYKDLSTIASQVSQGLNDGLIQDHHIFDVRNTNTRFDDEAMKHSLTFFAINNNKPAFAIETSKNLPTLEEKVFYQLRAIEGYMQYMGISYQRPFELTAENLKKIIKNNGNVTINNKINLSLENLRKDLSFIPLESKSNGFSFTHPLGGMLQDGGKYNLYIGNQKISSLSPSVHAPGQCSEQIGIEIDGKVEKLDFAKEYIITADVSIINKSLTRTNIIGFTHESKKDESNIHVTLKDFDPKYSIDKEAKTYRIEFYRENDFCGMTLIHFK
ncbi:MAG: M99 family carboxypeptidase catalytic domain-containing protein [Sulfuricurvum sp.]|nr:M99 family carboxypeptidase catalytic domain-containing protein [Sulfuricurvum sp.]MDP3022690.1 M99 family carboxypeptidase catalytic domain-containing protein [Sulfuricurvum sp.]